MAKNNNELLEATEKCKEENKKLQQQLRVAEESIDAIKKGNIDALVNANEKELNVYTQKTADKTYRILIEKMHEGAVTLNKDKVILYCNSCFAKMVNRPLQKVIGKTIEIFIDDSSKERFDVLFKQGWNGHVKDEVYIVSNDHKPIPVLMSVNTFELESTFVLSMILTDLTIQNKNKEELKSRANQLEQKNVQLESTNKELAFQIEQKEQKKVELNIAKTDVKELEALNTHKENILAILSHDLRSPLSGIIGTAEYLKSNFDKMENVDVKEMLDLLYKASTDELNMLDSLVEWARIKYASEAFSPKQIELVQYVNKVFGTLNENAVANNLQLQNEIEENTIVFADGKMLLSILQNIISNSIKHTPSGGKISVISKKEEDKIIVEVKDTGVGMPKEIQDKLFTPQMSSLSKARKDNKGAGIGLLLVKGFLEKNGGKIWVESKEGEGSSFYFTLPATEPLIKVESADQIVFEKND